ncbi:nitroreductase family protein [Streptomyces chumphonensis]|uniref:Nitroreductase family protein n=2 Tax=Streptomyces chumphonensis TaxID=1214925 RepID=A0A927EZC8_9ACTN|nr:nitroreductase family protein [Streptomyces chumphonensis]MBD3931812.1 nitroreductase family protein [Streptomyces chumphonensis]
MGYAHDYAAAIMQRGRVPMDPADFVPDWADGPRKTKLYPFAETVPLPASHLPPEATVERGLDPAAAPSGRFDLAALSGLLLDSYGLTGRRLGVQANTDLNALPFYPLANWSRGTASGGGLYPVSIYWVSGAGGPGTPGVHYYATRHHAMQRLLTGDVSGRVRAALGPGHPARDTDQFLVLGVKYWQNAFKYNSFSFHAVSMDVGACLQTWRMWGAARGLPVEPELWFDEEDLADLLGVDPAEEGLFAVVPLPWDGPAPGGATGGGGGGDRVRHRDLERSRTVLTFDALRAMQDATCARAADRPAPGALVPAAAPAVDPARPRLPLPAPAPLDTDVRTALRTRRSSFGRFDAARPVAADQLAACLRAAARGCDVGGRTTAGQPPLVTLYAFVNHVEGVEPGGYVYTPGDAGTKDDPGGGGALRLVRPGAPGAFLQENYFLANYNLEQAGAVLVPTVRTHAVLDAVGDRGYRLVNATIGALAQSTYTACSALGLGCGVALGFDNISYIEELELAATGEAPLLIMMVGHERPEPADFRFEIV